MTIAAQDLADIRDEIGAADPPSDAEIGTRWERMNHDNARVILSVLRDRLNALLATSAMVDVVGVYRHDSRANIAALERRISEVASGIEGEIGDSSMTVTTLIRSDRDATTWR